MAHKPFAAAIAEKLIPRTRRTGRENRNRFQTELPFTSVAPLLGLAQIRLQFQEIEDQLLSGRAAGFRGALPILTVSRAVADFARNTRQ